LPDGEGAASTLAGSGQALEFLKDQYRHCKTILVLGAASALLGKAGITAELPGGGPDPGLLFQSGNKHPGPAFIRALAQHRHVARDHDPPMV